MIAEASRGRWFDPEIDFSTFPSRDGKPMADTERNQREMINTMFALRPPLDPAGHHVGGNLIIYYNPANGLEPGTLWVPPTCSWPWIGTPRCGRTGRPGRRARSPR